MLTELAWLLDRKRTQRSGIMQASHACDLGSTPNVRNVREVRVGLCACYFSAYHRNWTAQDKHAQSLHRT